MKRHRFRPASLCVLLVATSAVRGYAGQQPRPLRQAEPPKEPDLRPDWPRWRGPDGNSITRESGWRPESLLPTPKILWRTNVGYGYSSVCIKGRYLYTMGYAKGKDTVYCLSVDDGKEVWRHSYPCKRGSYAGPRATPAFSDSLVYTVSRQGHLYCFDAGTGKVKWQRDLARDANARAPTWGIASSPVIEGDMLLLNVGKHGLALDKTSGDTIWQSPKAICGYASPVLYDSRGPSRASGPFTRPNGRRCMVCFGQKAAYGVEVRTGRLLWSKPWITKLDETSSDPVVWNDQVFISTIYSKGCTVFGIGGDTPKQVWLNRNLTTKFSTSVLFGGNLFGVHGNTGRRGGPAAGSVRCVDWATGKIRWKHDIGFSSLTIADGKLVILTEEGTLVFAEAGTDRYRELARGRVIAAGERFREAKGKCWTAPVFCRGRVFCRNDKGHLVCVDVR